MSSVQNNEYLIHIYGKFGSLSEKFLKLRSLRKKGPQKKKKKRSSGDNCL